MLFRYVNCKGCNIKKILHIWIFRTHFQHRITILKYFRFNLTVQAHFVNQTLFGIQSNIFEITSSWDNSQFHRSNNAFRIEIDSNQGYHLMQREKEIKSCFRSFRFWISNIWKKLDLILIICKGVCFLLFYPSCWLLIIFHATNL